MKKAKKPTKKAAKKTASRLLQSTSDARDALRKASCRTKAEFVLKADEEETAQSVVERAAKLGIVLSVDYVYVARSNARKRLEAAKAKASRPARKRAT